MLHDLSSYISRKTQSRKKSQSPNKSRADPLLYDRLVRRFQTAEERAAARRTRGFAATLSADLSRAEARLAALPANKSTNNTVNGSASGTSSERQDTTAVGIVSPDDRVQSEPFLIEPDSPTTRAEGLDQWRSILTRRFISGLDSDFDYTLVDGPGGNGESVCDEDEEDEMERQERWFEEDDDEEDDDEDEIEGDMGTKEEESEEDRAEEYEIEISKTNRTERDRKHKHEIKRIYGGPNEIGRKKKKILTGETGIQDF